MDRRKIQKKAWTVEEDETLHELVKQFGTANW